MCLLPFVLPSYFWLAAQVSRHNVPASCIHRRTPGSLSRYRRSALTSERTQVPQQGIHEVSSHTLEEGVQITVWSNMQAARGSRIHERPHTVGS
jgi:hypothetical protein